MPPNQPYLSNRNRTTNFAIADGPPEQAALNNQHSKYSSKDMKRRNSAYRVAILLVAAVGALAWVAFRSGGEEQLPKHNAVYRNLKRADGIKRKDTVIIYIFSNTDPEYINNLRFFATFGISEGDGCDYFIVIQDSNEETLELPILPKNAHYLRHPNKCYDWGTIGWAIESGQVDLEKYTYFIFMNSSVRGPFIPPHLRNFTSWQELLINKLNDKVALVGPTISCEGSPYQGNVKGEWRANPHVQSYVLATDRRGIEIWKADKNVFGCWDSMWDVIWHGELGSSLAILNAGYTLDSFMMRYQGVDWQDTRNWACNKKANPYGEHYYDGISLNPFEVLFVKVKEKVVQNEWSFAMEAIKYGQWMEQQANGVLEVVSNIYRTNPGPIQAPRLAYMKMRGPDCFDADYYAEKNADIKQWKTKEELWSHFLRSGCHEGRAYRFTCDENI